MGIVAEISTLIADKGLNIVSMEVVRKNNKADVYIEAEKSVHGPNRKEIFEMLGRISDLIEMKFIETLPQEMRENRFKVVLDNIRDGVISIDSDAKITTINRVARRILNCENKEVIGKDIKELNLPDYNILQCLNGKKFSNVKKNLITEKGRFQYFATGRPITDSSGRIVGAVEIGKDMQEIKMLAQSISQPSHVSFSDIIGENPVIKEAISFAQKIGMTDSIVSIRGESGTGKELFARAIHAVSEREGPFIPINCAALPEPLLESELFGYVSGAFTGAKKEGKAGLFEMANGGSIFLDEIGEMPSGVQAKILRVIQEKSVRRIGGSKEIPINTRIITATNKNLEQMVKERLFREDLYYRINVLPIHVPPLRERPDDIASLVEHFLFQLDSKLNKNAQSLTKEALNKLLRHGWPGNVRELKNVIERAAILCNSDQIEADYILFSFEIGKSKKEMKNQFHPGTLKGHSLQALLDLYEKQIICESLESFESIRKAAKSLSISHTALLNKLKKHNLRMETK
jgi:transcriptional regulator of aroF, aroG, tyrA and aromatic amino acid transport